MKLTFAAVVVLAFAAPAAAGDRPTIIVTSTCT
jgi:hypothetical protein